MSDDLDLAEAELELSKAKARKVAPPSDGVAPGSPLAQARAASPDEVLTIQTPTGPWTGTRAGVPVETAKPRTEQVGDMPLESDPRDDLRASQSLLSILSGGAHGLEKQAYGIQKAGEYLPTAVKNYVTGTPGESVVERYRRMRDEMGRTVNEATREASPTVKGIPVLPMLGAIGTAGPAAEGFIPLMTSAGAGSAMQSLADSPADLTKGEFGRAALDTGIGTAQGMALALPFAGAGALAQRSAGTARAGAAVEREAGVAQDLAKAEKLRNSQQGVVRGLGGEQQKTLDRFKDVALNEAGEYSDDAVVYARQFLQSEEAKALRARAFENLKDNPSRLMSLERSAREELAPLVAAATPEAAAGRFAEKEGSAFVDQAVKTGKSVVPRVATGLAADLFGSTGAAVGLTSPGTQQMMRNATKNHALMARGLESMGGNFDAAATAASTASRAAPEALHGRPIPDGDASSGGWVPKSEGQPVAGEKKETADELTERFLGRPPKSQQEAAQAHFVAAHSTP